jgi:putative membrane protein
MDRLTDCGWMPMMGIGFLSMVLFWAVLVGGLFFAGRWLWGQGTLSRADSALEILKKRYARGEITKQEFEDMKRDVLA